jgi:DNA-binding response OmpR family regulator
MIHKILIVDDEPNNLEILNNCLEEADFEVMTAKVVKLPSNELLMSNLISFCWM